ncbi:PAS domain S-box-containing protein/diguanylate cyclase (GGDEF)-like protein [Kushneria sinocarnis]|uniref:PAS domain S-box-containing protein/diguanylate cyclase (GGDEF)-like protein n=1 Tax=Kushneria sinocarnis TaxID=595502 RepID=A0A420X165_9GAMM|nr:diguanylate cyclase [Kushneria sinocarnis]RKR07490.1 PAS domain S-box-containing protein/diguanylate cyclase (GGDEF)-like protein [Kushneria sinocarnis]
MAHLIELFRTRLALRTAAIILLMVALLGAGFLVLAVEIRADSEQRAQYTRIEELLSTVERTTQIACFLGDRELAGEVADGLLVNRIVREVRIIRQTGDVLADARSEQGRTGPAISRAVYSPFEQAQPLCRIALIPDQQRIDDAVFEASRFLAVALLLQLAGVGLCVVLVVVHFVTRPITGISHRLSRLEAETGHKLQAPRGNQHDEIGQLVASVNAMIDHLVSSLSEERRLRLEREVEERRYRTIFDSVEAGIFELDGEGRIVVANPAFRRLFRLAEECDPVRRRVALTELAGDGGPSIEELVHHSEPGRARQWELALGSGTLRRWISILLNRLEEGRLQGVAHDITERKMATDAAERLAITDPLTGLGNRLGMERRLAVIARHHRLYPERPHALVVLDFDHFKHVNDTWGHQAGDRVLEHVAALLTTLVGQRDYLARQGGDEFVMVLEGQGQRDQVAALLARFIELLADPIELDEEVRIRMGASIGVAILGLDTEDVQEALHFADQAMYRAKRAGRNNWRFHQTTSELSG